jgi:hypothetical protein
MLPKAVALLSVSWLGLLLVGALVAIQMGVLNDD